jgi:CxxC motif-containing protein (DUF1111 family)
MPSRLVAVTCPSCGFSKSVPFDKCPPNATATSCPRCKTNFFFSRDAVSLQVSEASLDDFALPEAQRSDTPANCPKCGYQRQGADSVFDAASCPKCHVVYAKWTSPGQPAASSRVSGIIRPVNAATLVYHREPTLFLIHSIIAGWASCS